MTAKDKIQEVLKNQSHYPEFYREFLAIGKEEGYPNSYVISTDGASKGIYFLDHEESNEEMPVLYPSLENFAAELLERILQDEEDNGKFAEADAEEEDDE